MEKQMKIQFADNYAKGGVTYSQWLKDNTWQEQFNEWMEDGNVIKLEDGYSTQDAQYTNRLKDISALKRYFYNEFIKGQYDSYAGGGEVLNRIPKTYELELDYKVGQWFKEDIVGGTADCYITSIDFQVNEINGLAVVHPDSYRIEYKNTTYGSTHQVHYNFIKNLKKEKNKIKIEVPYSIGGGIFFENSGWEAFNSGTKLLNGVVEAFKVMYYGTRNDWFNYYTNINGKDYSVDSKDAYSSINNYISRVSNDGFVEKKLETFKEPIGGELKVKLDYEIGQKIKVPVMGGFEESEITGITIGIDAEDGKIVKNNHNSTISYKNVWGGKEDVTEIYANFEKEEYANKIENEIIIDIKALYLEQYITLHRYMGGAKLKVDRVQGYKLIIDKNGIKIGYIADDVIFEIFTSINDFKEKISYNDLTDKGEKFVEKKAYADGGAINKSIGLDDRAGVLRNKIKYDDYITNRYFYNVGKIGYTTKDFSQQGIGNIFKGTPYLIIGDGNVSKKEYDEVFRNETKLLVKIGSEFYNSQYFNIVLLDDKYAGGGTTDDKHLIAKAIEYVTGYAVDTDTIQDEANNYSFRYKGRNVWSTLNSKLVNDTIRMHRKSLESRYADGGGVENLENYINIDKIKGEQYKIVTDFRTLKSLARNEFIELHENTGLRYRNYEDKMKSQVVGRVTNVRHDYIKSATSSNFEYNNKKYAIGYIKGLNFLELYVLEDLSNNSNSYAGGGKVKKTFMVDVRLSNGRGRVMPMSESVYNDLKNNNKLKLEKLSETGARPYSIDEIYAIVDNFDNDRDRYYAGGGRTMENRAKKQARTDIKTH